MNIFKDKRVEDLLTRISFLEEQVKKLRDRSLTDHAKLHQLSSKLDSEKMAESISKNIINLCRDNKVDTLESYLGYNKKLLTEEHKEMVKKFITNPSVRNQFRASESYQKLLKTFSGE